MTGPRSKAPICSQWQYVQGLAAASTSLVECCKVAREPGGERVLEVACFAAGDYRSRQLRRLRVLVRVFRIPLLALPAGGRHIRLLAPARAAVSLSRCSPL